MHNFHTKFNTNDAFYKWGAYALWFVCQDSSLCTGFLHKTFHVFLYTIWFACLSIKPLSLIQSCALSILAFPPFFNNYSLLIYSCSKRASGSQNHTVPTSSNTTTLLFPSSTFRPPPLSHTKSKHSTFSHQHKVTKWCHQYIVKKHKCAFNTCNFRFEQ